ncbi:Swt1 family HEPN domain-containing protein [Thiotrichales bacterium HSG1]|nr:Swt1 family HEPN domain-containing protein [Thiotrichales bacterium HSG1]
MPFSIEYLCNTIKSGLQQEPQDSKNKIKVIDVKLLNNSTIVCEFCPYSKGTIEIKVEIAYIISFMASFFGEDNFGHETIKNFGARAYSNDNEEIMYAISSKESANFLSQGNPIEWMKGTIFQENTEEHRLHLAKAKVSELENTLRKLIVNVLAEQKGDNWWNTCVESEIKNDVNKIFPICEETPSGSELIEYTYLVHLQKIISHNWEYFNSLFESKTKLKKFVGSLNNIRINEAHNRVITSDSIKKLEKIYSEIMSKIANLHPELVSNYLIENWRIQVKNIVNYYVDHKVEIKNGCKLEQAILLINTMIQQLKEVEIKLASVPIPPTKQNLHHELVHLFNTMRTLFEKMVKNAENGDVINVKKNSKSIEENNSKIRKFTEKYIFSET